MYGCKGPPAAKYSEPQSGQIVSEQLFLASQETVIAAARNGERQFLRLEPRDRNTFKMGNLTEHSVGLYNFGLYLLATEKEARPGPLDC